MQNKKIFRTMCLTALAFLTIASCEKKKNSAFMAPEGVVNVTCGTIDVSPKNSLYPHTTVNFEPIFPNGVSISNLQWTFKKGSTVVHTTTDTLVSRTFNGVNEGAGTYVASLTFNKSDGNSCALEQSFQILQGDICVPPSGISGPVVGYVGEETSPFYVDYEDCFQGKVLWDMNNDGVQEYDAELHERVTYTYNQAGTYTVSAIAVDSWEGTQTSYTHTIEIKNKSCLNPFTNQPVLHGQSVQFAKPSLECGGLPCATAQRVCTNGTFGGDTTYSENPEMCAISPECPAPEYSYSWTVGEYGACSATACGTTGTQTRTVSCVRNDGELVLDAFCTDPKPATSKACSAKACNSCSLPWGGTLAHGKTTTAYKKNQVEYGGTCESEIRTCNDGTLSGSYASQSCSITEPANCTLDGTTVPHGQSHVFYAPETVACGQTCASQKRACNNGKLDGNASYNKVTCSVQACKYAWLVGEYGACSAVACGTSGVQTRSVTCVRGDGVTVVDSFCTSEKPSTTKPCSTAPCVVNGTCGSANGALFSTAPTTNLCSTGTASKVSISTSSYSWSCSGANGGSSESCKAKRQYFTGASSCGFGLASSSWNASPGQPTSSFNSCEWAGELHLTSSKKVYAVFYFGDFYDTSGSYGVYRLSNPSNWVIAATGCTLGTQPDPKNPQKKLPNYCKTSESTYNGTNPLVWNATIMAYNKTTGEVVNLPMTATFKPKLTK